MISNRKDIISEVTMVATRYAYVTLLMKGDAYLSGLRALSASLHATGTAYDLVCMITPDVDGELVAPLVTTVQQVEYLNYETKELKTVKQRQTYGSWIASSYTKWAALTLTSYEKVLFLDLDVVVLENLDALFELQAPAATFSNAWAQPYLKGRGALFNPYSELKHGDSVPAVAIAQGLMRSFVLIGTTVLLQPSLADFAAYQEMVQSQQPYGREGCYSGSDEQSLASFYQTQWTHIGQRYNMIPWHQKSWLPVGETSAVAHYSGQKPWLQKRDAWPDLALWWQYHDAS